MLNEYPARLIPLLIRLFKWMDFLSETDDSNLVKTTNSFLQSVFHRLFKF